ncbi:MAG: hypothetical protein MUC92_12670, partial [Fimbriimonadaceae bacterium]|nr:hypothetical protein [Fimbriimonadaceae bacterium]
MLWARKTQSEPRFSSHKTRIEPQADMPSKKKTKEEAPLEESTQKRARRKPLLETENNPVPALSGEDATAPKAKRTRKAPETQATERQEAQPKQTSPQSEDASSLPQPPSKTSVVRAAKSARTKSSVAQEASVAAPVTPLEKEEVKAPKKAQAAKPKLASPAMLPADVQKLGPKRKTL